MTEIYNEVVNWLHDHETVFKLVQFLGVLLVSWVVYFITKRIIIQIVKRIVKRTQTIYDDILLQDKILKRVSYLVPLIVIGEFVYLLPEIAAFFVGRVSEVLIAYFILRSITETLTGLNAIYEGSERFRGRPIKGYIQVVKIIIYILGGVIIVGIVTNQEPWTLLTGLGALTAVLLLIFKDTILSFVASIQITSYDMIKVGDWITVPNYNADGDVIDISLHTIKVQNFDKTITMVPTAKLIEGSFINWRGMQETGGRRIKRSVYVDISSIKFCDEKMLAKYENIQLLNGYLDLKKKEVLEFNKKHNIKDSSLVNGRRLTNIGTFRAYLNAYLQNRKDIDKKFTFLIRQLPSTSQGVPIEIYVFTNTTAWIDYEGIQSDVFDHVLAAVPEFELKIFQEPAGSDILSAIGKFGNGSKPDDQLLAEVNKDADNPNTTIDKDGKEIGKP